MLFIGLVVQIAVLFVAFQLIALPVGIFSSIGFMKVERWAALSAVTIAITVTLGLAILSPKVELSPSVTPQALLGTWSSENRQLQLSETTYTVQSDGVSYENKWKLTDWNLYLSKDGAPDEYLRVIKYDDDFRLLIDAEGKEDSYVYSNAFIKQ